MLALCAAKRPGRFAKLAGTGFCNNTCPQAFWMQQCTSYDLPRASCTVQPVCHRVPLQVGHSGEEPEYCINGILAQPAAAHLADAERVVVQEAQVLSHTHKVAFRL